MMFERESVPWIEFPHIEHATEVTLVRADAIASIERGPSGVRLLLVGSVSVTVRGSVNGIRQQLDEFWVKWCATDVERRRAFDEKVSALRGDKD